MSKLRLLLALSALAAVAVAASAAPALQTAWQINAGDTAWFANDNNTRDLAYNAVTDHVLVVSRTGGLSVQILDAATGMAASPSTMSVAGVAGGTFPLSHIDVADDGVIYGANLTINAVTTAFTVYRWASEEATATVAYSATGEISGRTGDAFAVTGAGASTTIYATGSANVSIEVFTTGDGVTFAHAGVIGRANDDHRLGIDVLPGGNLLISDPGSQVQEIDGAGSVLNSVATSEIDNLAAPLSVGSIGGLTLAVVQGGPVSSFGGTVLDITGGVAAATAIGVIPASGNPNDPAAPNANGNGVGAAELDTTNQTVLFLNTNNSIGSYFSNAGGVPVELSVFSEN